MATEKQFIGATGLTFTGTALLAETALSGIAAGTTRTQAGATPLLQEVNRIDTSTAPAAGTILGDGVLLMPSVSGLDVTVINNTANIITVYPNGTDSLNGQGAGVGLPIPPNCVEQFECPIAGSWYYDAGVGFAGALPTQLAIDGIVATGSNQAGAAALPADFNRLTAVTAGQGVVLPVAKAGVDVFVLNHGGATVTVYGNGSDTVDDVAGPTGVVQMNRSVVLFTCYTNGAWYTEGLSTGYSPSGLQTILPQDAVSAAGTTQGTATQLTGAVVNVTTVGLLTGVNLPASFAGLQIVITASGVNPLSVYAFQGSSDTINGATAAIGITMLPGSVATFTCTLPGVWTTQIATTKQAAYTVNAATTSTTLTSANVTGGGASVDLALTAALGGAANATLPTVTAMVLAIHSATIGTSYRLRITNQSAGAFAWTVLTNTGWTVTGTMSIAQNTWREFVVTLNSLTTATLQNVATGTFS